MKTLAAFAVAAMFAQPALAQHQTLAINPDTSQVTMTLKTNHEIVNGTFHVQSGSIAFDRSAPKLSGSVVIAADSGKTGNGGRDKKMDKEILKVHEYTTISFAPKTYTGTIAPSGESSIKVSGVFTLLGAPHELTIPMQVQLKGSKAVAKANFLIPYVEWGLKNPSFLVWKAEDEVAVTLSLAGDLTN